MRFTWDEVVGTLEELLGPAAESHPNLLAGPEGGEMRK